MFDIWDTYINESCLTVLYSRYVFCVLYIRHRFRPWGYSKGKEKKENDNKHRACILGAMWKRKIKHIDNAIMKKIGIWEQKVIWDRTLK